MALGKCIICTNEADGEPVADTQVIKAIRAVKQRLGMAQNNTLVVCPADIEAHAKKRKNFESKWATHAIVAAAIVVFFVLVPPVLGASFNPASLVLAPMLAGFILLLSVTEYIPPLASSLQQPAPLAPSQQIRPYPTTPPASRSTPAKGSARPAKPSPSSSKKKKR